MNDKQPNKQCCLRKVTEGGGVINTTIAAAAARGIVLRYAKERFVDFGGHMELTRYWTESLLAQMNSVQWKATTAKSEQNLADFSHLKETSLNDVKVTATMEEVPVELVTNWNQAGVKIVPGSKWTLEEKRTRCVEVVGIGDKRQITVVLCSTY